MKSLRYLMCSCTVLILSISPVVQAIPMPPIPLEPIYFEPPVVQSTDEIRNQSCYDLDNAVRYLQPYRYSYKPKFNEDGFNKAAVASITIDNVLALNGLLGFAYLGYSALVEEKEGRRILQVEQQIAMLQQVKAEKHCFE